MTAPASKVVAIERVHPNGWNPNRVPERIMAALVANVKRAGFNQPLLVRPLSVLDEEPEYEIVDGEHRWRAAKEAGLKEVTVIPVVLTDEEAIGQTLAHNRLRGEMEPSEVAAILAETEMPVEELAKFTGYSVTELEALLALRAKGFEEQAREAKESEDESWHTVAFRVPESIAKVFVEELERVKAVMETGAEDWQALREMAVRSAKVPVEELS